jgi:hypothetical protein
LPSADTGPTYPINRPPHDPRERQYGRFLLADWIDRKAEDDLEPSTAGSYRSKIDRHLIPRLGSLGVQTLDVATI